MENRYRLHTTSVDVTGERLPNIFEPRTAEE